MTCPDAPRSSLASLAGGVLLVLAAVVASTLLAITLIAVAEPMPATPGGATIVEQGAGTERGSVADRTYSPARPTE